MDCPYCRPDREKIIREAGMFFVLRGDQHREGVLDHRVIVPKQHTQQAVFICRMAGVWQQIPEIIEDLRNRGNLNLRLVVNMGERANEEQSHGSIEILIPQPRHGLDDRYKAVTELEPAPATPEPEAIAPEGGTPANAAISKLVGGSTETEGPVVIVGPAAEMVEAEGDGTAGVEGEGAGSAESK